MTTILLALVLVVCVAALWAFVRAHRTHVTIATVIHGEVDHVKKDALATRKRLAAVEAKLDSLKLP